MGTALGGRCTMRRTVAVSLLAVGLLLAPIAAAAAPGFAGASEFAGPMDASGSTQDAGNASLAPGEQIAGALGAEGAALDTEVSERSFGVQLAAAETNGSTAGVVAERLDAIETRLDELEAQNATLAEQYENGSLSHGAYAAQAAIIEVERASLARQLNASQTATRGLPADVIAENGVDTTAIETLRSRASELGGQQVRELAQSIAGPGVGNGFGPPGKAPGTIPGFGGDGPPGGEGGGNGPGVGENSGGENGVGDAGNGTDGVSNDSAGDGDGSDGTSGDSDADTDDSGSSTEE